MNNDDIKVYRLASGEEIVGRAVADPTDADRLVLEKVFSVGLQQNPQTKQVMLQMVPYVVSCPEATIALDRSQCVPIEVIAGINKDLVKSYIERTTSIQLLK